jgi:hypothetical protein
MTGLGRGRSCVEALRKRNGILPLRGMLRARAGPTAMVSEGSVSWNATRIWHSTSCELNQDRLLSRRSTNGSPNWAPGISDIRRQNRQTGAVWLWQICDL